VLPPRAAGTTACLAARPDADVVVVAHSGLDTLINPGQIWRAIPLDGRSMRVTWWLYRACEVPREADRAEQWLEQRWSEVHDWVARTADSQSAPA
jgi:hypothetical protein